MLDALSALLRRPDADALFEDVDTDGADAAQLAAKADRLVDELDERSRGDPRPPDRDLDAITLVRTYAAESVDDAIEYERTKVTALTAAPSADTVTALAAIGAVLAAYVAGGTNRTREEVLDEVQRMLGRTGAFSCQRALGRSARRLGLSRACGRQRRGRHQAQGCGRRRSHRRGARVRVDARADRWCVVTTPTCGHAGARPGAVCDRRTVVRTIRERALTDSGHPQVRVRPEHGEFRQANDRGPEPSAGTA
ncbi:hypothetical protein J1G43_12900 [Cellulomonas sp. zg-ZUI22]|uniref:hypothetical protein n=1 Tax=Cellulomonas sp. zg-ZUI22 TaxID=2816955 RepID=UPI001A9519AC|nr:hypothetical protein [Cellulomonas sp. zg-ZUI22]MBO0900862.1 hypothetical protein [Cellulomonas sp. zg-ZUI22]